MTDRQTGEIRPVVVVIDNGGPFRFEAFIASRSELRRVRTRVRAPGQNGVRDRAFGSSTYERLYRSEIDDAVALDREAEAFRVEFNTIRPRQALAWNRPLDVHQGRAEPTAPTVRRAETLPASWRGTATPIAAVTRSSTDERQTSPRESMRGAPTPLPDDDARHRV